ncbi:MAG TPA: TIGR04282 family arsenosugar biosynthesis glycosyltransferase [Acidimicrobiales bacterium]|nr:TIGR04282 family arsenosugar biosynthesis glycosyltransferase [Acidimicrobiales bacterium]
MRTPASAGGAGRPAFQVLVLAKEPVAGKVKTRLCPPLSPEAAAVLALAALLDTLAAATASAAARCVLALDGRPGPWLPDGVVVMPQRPGGLGDRLAGAMGDAWATRPLPMVLIGMDTPQVTAAQLDSAAAALVGGRAETVLGLAEDGGWWAIGARRPEPAMFDEVPMSTARTGAAQRARLDALRLSCAELAVLRDVDRFDDAVAVARAHPATRFAKEVEALLPAVVGAGG